MSGVTAAMLVVLALAAPLRTPDLQVEAVNASGAGLPELAEAVARALVAGGARVVLRGPSSGSCEYCAKVRVTEIAPGECEVAIQHEQRAASTTLHLPAGSLLFDRARAIAIQTRLLMAWRTAPEPKPKEIAARPVRKSDGRLTGGASRPATSPPVSAKPDAVEPYLATRRAPAPVPSSPSPSAPIPVATPTELPRPAEPVPLVTYTSRSDGKPANRAAEVRPVAEAQPDRADAPALERPESKPSASSARANSRVNRAPAADLGARREVSGERPRWPWIPIAVGGGAAVAAGIFAALSRDRYDALADKNQPIESARSHKSAGEHWQTASLVLAGVAAAAVGTGIVGFVMGGPDRVSERASERASGRACDRASGRACERASDAVSVTALAAPIPGGGMLALAGWFR